LKVVDLNLLIYAVNRDSPFHKRSRAWAERALSGEETVALPWAVVLGFLRVTTSPRILAHPLSTDQAIATVSAWLDLPNVVLLEPGDKHWELLQRTLSAVGTAGNLTNDAHLAVLAIEYGAELCSSDADFGRFSGLRWINPLIE
jgi:toxin-antitoxin system PIN domain toxin